MKERKTSRSGAYQLHHFVVSLFCVFALVCIVSSLYSITNKISSIRSSVKRFARSLNEDSADLNDLNNTEEPEERKELFSTKLYIQNKSTEVHAPSRSLDPHMWYRTIRKRPKDAHLLLPVEPSYFTKQNKSHEINNNNEAIPETGSTVLNHASNHDMSLSDKSNNLSEEKTPHTSSDASTRVPGSDTLSGVPVSVATNSIRNGSEDAEENKYGKHTQKKEVTKLNKRKKIEDGNIPEFPENYHASGLLILPHSSIAEPFEIWYAPDAHKSRIDYYYGTLVAVKL